MTNRERENITLSFGKPSDRGSIEETFFPWALTIERFKNEGLPYDIANYLVSFPNDLTPVEIGLDKYLNVMWGGGVLQYERYMGFDPVRRISFTLPFRRFEEVILEDTPEYSIKQDIFGRQIKHNKKV